MYEPRVKLTWDDQNEIESGYKIYRSLSTLSTESLPEPLAVLPVNSNEYIDLDVIDGQTYHYLVSAYSPYDEVFSGEIMSEANIANGPGPKTLIAGDMTAGFFGEVPTTELFSGTELSSMIGLTAGTAQHSTQPWLKFAKDNKIIFQ